METSQNGWPVLEADELRRWLIPDKRGKAVRQRNGDQVVLPLARGAGGFVLVHLATWFNDVVERIDTQTVPDDWGWAPRPIRGSSTISNHASASAMDLNATRHPMGVPTRTTFTSDQVKRIHRRLRFYRRCIRWGGDYISRPDAMHWELDKDRRAVQLLAAVLRITPRGRRVVALNPWEK